MKNENNMLEFIVYAIFIFIIYSIAVLAFYHSSFYGFDLFSFSIGFALWIMFYMNSQRIISKNLFKQFTLLGIFAFILSIFLFKLTNGMLLSLIITAYPLLYILYFYLLMKLFFKDFSKSYKKPTILFASRSHWTTDSESDNYMPSKKEKIFSYLLFGGFFVVAIGTTSLII